MNEAKNQADPQDSPENEAEGRLSQTPKPHGLKPGAAPSTTVPRDGETNTTVPRDIE